MKKVFLGAGAAVVVLAAVVVGRAATLPFRQFEALIAGLELPINLDGPRAP